MLPNPGLKMKKARLYPTGWNIYPGDLTNRSIEETGNDIYGGVSGTDTAKQELEPSLLRLGVKTMDLTIQLPVIMRVIPVQV